MLPEIGDISITSSTSELRRRYHDHGFVGPIRILSPRECRKVLSAQKQNKYPVPDWSKGLSVVSPNVYRVATMPGIIETVRQLIGNDVLLWGASIVTRKPGQHHPWHNDIESSVQKGKTLSVWIGLKNTSVASGLSLISRSHDLRKSVQEVRLSRGRARDSVTAGELLKWVREDEPGAELITPDIHDGEALFFNGWIWHGSHNTRKIIRSALLLQYATPDAPIRIPDPNNFEWPFKTLSHPKPPCIMVSGTDHYGVNRIVPAPTHENKMEQLRLTSQIYTFDMPLQPNSETGWKPYRCFRGTTQNIQSMSCHASALAPGTTPHAPHNHMEEEILIMLDGEADLTLPDLEKNGNDSVVKLQAGQFVYYPAWFYHTLTATGDKPANYLMFKWFNNAKPSAHALGHRLVSIHEHFGDPVSTGSLETHRVFREPTQCLSILDCHTSVILPGEGYNVHTDHHDVAIVMLEGEVETLDTRVGPYSVIYFPGGEPHGMHNPGQLPARYITFEFHGKYSVENRKRTKKSLLQKATSAEDWRKKILQIRSNLGI